MRGIVARGLVRHLIGPELNAIIRDARLHQLRVYGDPKRLFLHPTAQVNDALLNTNSGTITVGEEAFFGHNVCLLTGSHDTTKLGRERRFSIPDSGRNIVIEAGVWIASNSTVVGPCRIGENAVIGAHSLVIKDVPANSIAAGVPATVLRRIYD